MLIPACNTKPPLLPFSSSIITFVCHNNGQLAVNVKHTQYTLHDGRQDCKCYSNKCSPFLKKSHHKHQNIHGLVRLWLRFTPNLTRLAFLVQANLVQWCAKGEIYAIILLRNLRMYRQHRAANRYFPIYLINTASCNVWLFKSYRDTKSKTVLWQYIRNIKFKVTLPVTLNVTEKFNKSAKCPAMPCISKLMLVNGHCLALLRSVFATFFPSSNDKHAVFFAFRTVGISVTND